MWTFGIDHSNLKILLPMYVTSEEYGKVCVVQWDDGMKGQELSCGSDSKSCPQSTDTFKVPVKHVALDKTSK